MAKVDIELVKMVLTRNEVETRLVAGILQELQQEQAAEADDDKEKPCKKQWVVVVYDPEGELEGKEFTGTIVQIPEDESVYTAVERLHRAGYEFNTTKKGRRMPVKTVGDVCEHVPARIAKEQKIWIKHKEPCFLLPTDGLLPTDKSAATQSRRVSQTPLFAGEPEDPGFEKGIEAAMDRFEAQEKKTSDAALKEARNFLHLFKTDRDAAVAKFRKGEISPEAADMLRVTLGLNAAIKSPAMERLMDSLGGFKGALKDAGVASCTISTLNPDGSARKSVTIEAGKEGV